MDSDSWDYEKTAEIKTPTINPGWFFLDPESEGREDRIKDT
jgi:hypothetical protein